jgi:23S rRNA maturation-related 3'-5' exoribonuclease YhaM
MMYKSVRGWTTVSDQSVRVYARNEMAKKINKLVIEMSNDDFEEAFKKWERGTYIQDAFPKLTPAERDYLMTGITPAEQKELGI